MEGNSNWLEAEAADSFARKLNDLLTELECDNDMSSEFPMKEEMVEEIMQELYKEISPSTSTKPATWPASFPSLLSSWSPSQTSSSLSSSPFADGEGKGESCGASVSDSASTVMAGIEYVGPPAKSGSPGSGLWWAVEGGGCNYVEGGGEGFGETVNGCDGGELDDEWLGRLLSMDPLVLDDQGSSN